MALSSPETTSLNTAKIPENPSSCSVHLQKLPHLTDYLPNLKPLPNPLEKNSLYHPPAGFYINQSEVVLGQIILDLSADSEAASSPTPQVAYNRAGPRWQVFFEPKDIKAAIVTCGGLCPGMNTVVRELVVGLWEMYGVRQIYGVTAGYRGFYSRDPVELNPKLVHNWHKLGGTALETSRGGFDLNKIVDGIEHHGFNQVISLNFAPCYIFLC